MNSYRLVENQVCCYTNGPLVDPPGFEPELAEPKSAVLPVTPRVIVDVAHPGFEPELADPESAVLPVTPAGIGACGGIRTPCA